MGGIISRKKHGAQYGREFVADEAIIGQGSYALISFQKLGLEKERIDKLYKIFLELDSKGDGLVIVRDFFKFFGLQDTEYNHQVFTIMDQDSNGKVDFQEFVMATWNYCTYSMAALTKFAFGLCDLDDSGTLEFDEVRELVEKVYGKRAFEENVRVQKLLETLDVDGDGTVSLEEFSKFNRQFPLLLYPAFQLQNTLRIKLFGEKYWKKEEDRRRTALRGRNIYEILHEIDGMRKELEDKKKKRGNEKTNSRRPPWLNTSRC